MHPFNTRTEIKENIGTASLAQSAIHAIAKVAPHVAATIDSHLNLPLGDYAEKLYEPTRIRRGLLSGDAYRYFREEWVLMLKDQDIPAKTVQKLFKDPNLVPVVQSGPHHQLLLHPFSFYAAAFANLGLRRTGGSIALYYNCATITMEERRAFGPGWLPGLDAPINVFGLSRSVLSKTSVHALESHLSFSTQVRNFSKSTSLPPGPFPCASAAFITANQALWHSWSGDNSAPAIMTDQHLARLVARHLSEKDSLLSRLVLDPDRRLALMLALQDRAPGLLKHFLPQGTELFWGVRKGRIRSMMLAEDKIFERDMREGNSIGLDRTSLCTALSNGQLLPSLLISFLVLAILPRVRVLGGYQQICYYTIFAQALIDILRHDRVDETELASELSGNLDHYWGYHLVDETVSPLQWLEQGSDAPVFERVNHILERHLLMDTTRQLYGFRSHPKWSLLITEAEQSCLS